MDEDDDLPVCLLSDFLVQSQSEVSLSDNACQMSRTCFTLAAGHSPDRLCYDKFTCRQYILFKLLHACRRYTGS